MARTINNKTLLLASAVAGMLTVATFAANAQAADKAADSGNKVRCYGVNKCKGAGQCGGKGHSCSGKNSCKGKGYLMMDKGTCLKIQGGRLSEQKQDS